MEENGSVKKNTTESESRFHDLDKMTTRELLVNMNEEDKKVPYVVEKLIPQIEKLVDRIVERMESGGRLFYIGAGTSGRLGILDASECPPTYGVPHDMVIGLIAGGDTAIRKAVENAEDDTGQAWLDLQAYKINSRDTLIGIAASGFTPYVLGGVKKARKNGILTGCITCNEVSDLTESVDIPIAAVVGPEFVTGSTRMKAGTVQKLILNMISTSVMIRLGRVKGNKMVDMQLSNTKLFHRGVRIIMQETGVSRPEAEALLKKYGSVRNAIASL